MSIKELLLQQLEESDRKRAQPSKPKAKTAGREVHVDNDPGFMASWTVAQMRQPATEPLDLTDNLAAIEAQIAAIQGGDMSQLEAILCSQIVTLNALFADCLVRSAKVRTNGKTQTSLALADDLAHLALRAQGNCQKTIATLNEMKNPKRAVFIRHQQNLAIAQTDTTPQLQEAYGSEALDTRAARLPEAGCDEIEIVGKIDGSKDTRGQTQKRDERKNARA